MWVGRTTRDGAQRKEAGGSGVGGVGRREMERNGTGQTGGTNGERAGQGGNIEYILLV